MGATRMYKMSNLEFHSYKPLFLLFSTHLLFTLLASFLLLFYPNCYIAMTPKRSRVSQASTSSTPPTQDAIIFPNHIFFSKANAGKYLIIKYFKVVKERVFNIENLEGCEELVIMLEEKGWMRLNIMIKKTTKPLASSSMPIFPCVCSKTTHLACEVSC